jgi:hypothetical protein
MVALKALAAKHKLQQIMSAVVKLHVTHDSYNVQPITVKFWQVQNKNLQKIFMFILLCLSLSVCLLFVCPNVTTQEPANKFPHYLKLVISTEIYGQKPILVKI